MFTLRFSKDYYERVVSASEYEKDVREGFVFVIVNGVEYQVGGEHPKRTTYGVCFVENSSGKTIDRIAPK